MDRYTVTGRLREMLRSSCLTAARMKEALAVLRAVSSLHAAAEQQSSSSVRLSAVFLHPAPLLKVFWQTMAGRALGVGGVRCEERAFPTPCDG